MSKNDQNFDRFQEGVSALLGVARRTALASWGRLESILGLFGGYLGDNFSAPVLENVVREQISRF